MAKNTYGTGCFLLIHTGNDASVSPSRLITTIARRVGERVEYALEGSVFIAGAVVQWLRDGLGLIRSADEIEPLACSVPDSHDVYFVPAFAGLGAPHWDGHARGAIVGLTRGVTAGHLARAALEGIAHQVADVIDAARSGGHLRLSELRVDGGAAANDLLMQTQADLLGIPVVRPVVTETTALGAAYLAGMATGVWESDEDVAGHWRVERRFEPAMSPNEAAERRSRWNAAVERSKEWAAPDGG
jgi:glycerol kinase